jgi:Rrf2 family protein
MDYALLALSYLTRAEAGRSVNTKEIAEQNEIPVELLAKILQKLTKAKILTSVPGPTGGYHLARPATEISIGRVVEVIDGLPALMHCMKIADNDCGYIGRCTIRSPLMRINARIFQVLNHISLAEICGDEGGEGALPIIRQLETRAHPAQYSHPV